MRVLPTGPLTQPVAPKISHARANLTANKCLPICSTVIAELGGGSEETTAPAALLEAALKDRSILSATAKQKGARRERVGQPCQKREGKRSKAFVTRHALNC
jgi:hypothetical protein